MAKPRTTAQTRKQARLQRERERTAITAIMLSIATVFVVALASFIVMANTHGSALFNLWKGLQADVPISPRSALYAQLLSQVEYQEALIITPLSLLCGGIALGRLISPKFTRLRLLRVATAVSAGVLAACLLFRWTLIIAGQNWHLRAGEIDTRLELTQAACMVGWMVAYLLGTWLGVLWRDASHPREPKTPQISGIPVA